MKKLDINKMTIKDRVEFIRKNDKLIYDNLRNHETKIASRRDFIAHGLMAASSFALGLNLPFSNNALAQAQGCGAGGGGATGGAPPLSFLTINGEGGPCYTKSVLPTMGNNLNPQILSNNNLRAHNIGVGANPNNNNTTRQHYAPMHTNSAMYQAISQSLGPQFIQNMYAFLICNTSNNDSANPNNQSANVIARLNVAKSGNTLAGYIADKNNLRARPIGAADALVRINNANTAAGLTDPGNNR